MLNNWKQPIFRDAAYLSWVREQPCLICGVSPCDPHHLNMQGKHSGGMGLKTSDYRTVPLCREHHSEYHSRGRASFEIRHCIDLREKLIDTLESYIAQKQQQG